MSSNIGNTAQTSILPSQKVIFAIGLVCAASIPFALLDSTVKYLGSNIGLPVTQIIWLRFLTHILFTVILIGPTNVYQATKTSSLSMQSLRSLFLLGATGFNFYALQYLQLDQAVSIFFLSPLVVAMLAGPFLGEWIGLQRLAAIFVGFSGVLLVMQPSLEGIRIEFLLALMAAISYSCYNVCTRYLASYDSSATTQLYSPLAGLIAFTPLAFIDWQWPETWFQWGLLMSLGMTGGFGHWLVIVAHKYAPASTLAPFVYAALISMIVTGYLIFGDIPSVITLLGGCIVIGAGLYLLYRENKQEKAKYNANQDNME